MSYATTEDLARVLKKRDPDEADTEAMQRALDAATKEIDSELGRDDDADPFTGDDLALVTAVNLDRAQEHWQQEQMPFGIVGLGTEFTGRLARDTWDRHAHKLAPLKASWGLA